MPWQTPKTDWDTNPTNPLPSDFNRIEGNIDFLNIDIETKKGLIVNALSSVGIAALIADTHVQLASKITGAEKTGISIIPGTANQEIPKGIYDTGGGIVLGDSDLISANIKAGANIFGVAGNSNVVDTSGGDATSAQILSGKKAYVDGSLVTGTIPSKGAATITPGTTNQSIAAGQYLSGVQTIVGDADLISANIKTGVNIFGVIGSAALPHIKRIHYYYPNTSVSYSNLTGAYGETYNSAGCYVDFLLPFSIDPAYTVGMYLAVNTTRTDYCSRISFPNSNHLRLTRTDANNNNNWGYYDVTSPILIIEFESNAVRQILRGVHYGEISSWPGGSTTSVVTIPAVADVTKCFCGVSFAIGGSAGGIRSAVLKSTTQLEIINGYNSQTGYWPYFIVEMK
jgi:hypothetical protein